MIRQEFGVCWNTVQQCTRKSSAGFIRSFPPGMAHTLPEGIPAGSGPVRVAYGQDDFLALLNPVLFREFLLPLHQNMCLTAAVNFIHLHSGYLWPVDILLEGSRYDVLEINIDHEGAGPPVHELIPVFQRIQDAGKPLLLWGEISPDEHRLLRKQLRPAGLSIQPSISQREELEPWMRSWHP